RLPELEGGRGVAIDEGLLDRRFPRGEPGKHLRQAVEQLPEPLAEGGAVLRDDRAASHEHEPRPVAVDHAPAGAPKPRIDADDANRFAHHALGVAREAARFDAGGGPPNTAL